MRSVLAAGMAAIQQEKINHSALATLLGGQASARTASKPSDGSAKVRTPSPAAHRREI